MGWFDKLRGVSKGTKTQVKALQALNLQRINTNFKATYADWSSILSANIYGTIDDIYSIINLRTTTEISIPIYIYYEKNKTATKQLLNANGEMNFYQRKALQFKALEDIEETDWVQMLIEQPNDYQSKYEFEEALSISINTLGEGFIRFDIPELGVNKGKPRSMHIWRPPNVIVNTDEYGKVASYSYRVNGVLVDENVPADSVIHIKYYNPSVSNYSDGLRGLSPITVLKKRITRVETNLDNSVAQLENGGVPGIVYDKDTTDAAVGVVGQRKIDYASYAQNPKNTGGVYFASGEMGYLKLGLSLVDMDSVNLDGVDFKKLCNAYAFSARLLNNDGTGSENSDTGARKGLYLNAAWPARKRIAAAYQLYFSRFTDKKRVFYADVSEVPELQENIATMMKTLEEVTYLSPNEKREVAKFDKSTDPLMDKIYIKQGLVPIDEISVIEPEPVTTESL